MAPVAFTYDWYRSFLRDLLDDGYRFRAYDEAVEADSVLLRHDVDLSPQRSLRVAEIEADLGVSSTYFFLLGSPMYNPLDRPTREAIRSIESLGHDVGLHFSTHQYWPAADPPPEADLVERVEDELAVLSTVAERPTETVSFHIPPEWVLRRRFDGVESTYEPRFFDEIGYLADSNQRWREEHPLATDPPECLQVLTHPGLWGPVDGEFRERVVAAENEASRRVREYGDDRYLASGPVGEIDDRAREPGTDPVRTRKPP